MELAPVSSTFSSTQLVPFAHDAHPDACRPMESSWSEEFKRLDVVPFAPLRM